MIDFYISRLKEKKIYKYLIYIENLFAYILLKKKVQKILIHIYFLIIYN